MKAEHPTSTLGDGLHRAFDHFKTGSSRRGLFVLGLLAVAAVAVLGIFYLNSQNRKATSALWRQVEEADRKVSSAEDVNKLTEILGEMEETAKGHPNTPAALALRFQKARALMQLGLERLYAPGERAKALDHLKQAATLYEELIPDAGRLPALHQEALLMAGKARESLNQIDAALEHYDRLAKVQPETASVKEAKARRDVLAKPEGRAAVEDLFKKMNEIVEAGVKRDELPPPPSSSGAPKK